MIDQPGYHSHSSQTPESSNLAIAAENDRRTTDALLHFIEAVEKRVEQMEKQLPNQICNVVRESLREQLLTPDETTVVKLVIEKQRQQIALRKAIIEKTVPGLVWAGITGGGFLLWELIKSFLRDHGVKIGN